MARKSGRTIAYAYMDDISNILWPEEQQPARSEHKKGKLIEQQGDCGCYNCELLDMVFTTTLEIVRNRTSEKIYAELDNDKKFDARTAGICLATIDEVIDDLIIDDVIDDITEGEEE